jgi:DNA repair protein RadC
MYGPEALSTYELLAIILGNGIKGESVLLMAQKVLKAFGNLKGVSEASIEELSEIKGIGLARAKEPVSAWLRFTASSNRTTGPSPCIRS